MTMPIDIYCLGSHTWRIPTARDMAECYRVREIGCVLLGWEHTAIDLAVAGF